MHKVIRYRRRNRDIVRSEHIGCAIGKIAGRRDCHNNHKKAEKNDGFCHALFGMRQISGTIDGDPKSGNAFARIKFPVKAGHAHAEQSQK